MDGIIILVYHFVTPDMDIGRNERLDIQDVMYLIKKFSMKPGELFTVWVIASSSDGARVAWRFICLVRKEAVRTWC